ncbi:TPA: hypothetical protein DDW35_12995 [Candidatus Sumerlaeota bacterium]|jgi:hypothetical protein|nr:hypothetical protein [Candidatus Sumerlaeota bacterium]
MAETLEPTGWVPQRSPEYTPMTNKYPFLSIPLFLLGLLATPLFTATAAEPLPSTDAAWTTQTLSEIESLYARNGWVLPESGLMFYQEGNETSRTISLAPDWVEMPGMNLRLYTDKPQLKELPGEPFLDVDKTPRQRVWWKYPVYAVVGAPRDLVDGFFGGVGKLPLFNLPLTGVMYEVVPTQVVFRHWSDTHRWLGLRNHNAHGWIDSEEWGFFSNAHNMGLTREDIAEKERRTKQNVVLQAKLKETNQSIIDQNRAAETKREALLAEAMASFQKRDFRDAARRLHFLVKVDPLNQSARSLLAASLIALPADATSDGWKRMMISRLLQTHSQGMMMEIKQSLLPLVALPDTRTNALTYLVWINARLGNLKEARETAMALRTPAVEKNQK